LELAGKVGSLPDFLRALAEGADGGSPRFVSTMKGNREMVWQLLQAGVFGASNSCPGYQRCKKILLRSSRSLEHR
jgi:hypothetical protein